MTKQFRNLKEFADYLTSSLRKYQENEPKLLLFMGNYLEHKMKDTFGIPQKGDGPYQSWSPLKDSTVAEKTRLGYVYNVYANPLVRTGMLRDSIHSFVAPKRLIVGSDDPIMIYQEYGTGYIPPRSVIGLTMFKETMHISLLLKQHLMSLFQNKNMTYSLR